MDVGVGGVEKSRLKLTSAKGEVKVEAELGNKRRNQSWDTLLHAKIGSKGNFFGASCNTLQGWEKSQCFKIWNYQNTIIF